MGYIDPDVHCPQNAGVDAAGHYTSLSFMIPISLLVRQWTINTDWRYKTSS